MMRLILNVCKRLIALVYLYVLSSPIVYGNEKFSEVCRYPAGPNQILGEPAIIKGSKKIGTSGDSLFEGIQGSYMLARREHDSRYIAVTISKMEGNYDLTSIVKAMAKGIDSKLNNDGCPGRLQSMVRSDISINASNEEYIQLSSTITLKAGYCTKGFSGWGKWVNKRHWKKHTDIIVNLYLFPVLNDEGGMKFHIANGHRVLVIKNESLNWFSKFIAEVVGVFRGQDYDIRDLDSAEFENRVDAVARAIVSNIFDTEFYNQWNSVIASVITNVGDSLGGATSAPDIKEQYKNWASTAFSAMSISDDYILESPDCSVAISESSKGTFHDSACRQISDIYIKKAKLVSWNQGLFSESMGRMFVEEVPKNLNEISPKLRYGQTCQVYKLAAQEHVSEDRVVITKQGDSLWSLSESWYGSGALFHAISSYNDLHYNKVLPVEKKIVIPSLRKIFGEKFVKPTDSLWKLNIRAQSLQEFLDRNPAIEDPDLIYGGQLIK